MAKKSVGRDKLHNEFEDLLQRVQPNENLIQIFQENLEKQIQDSEKDKGLIIKTLKDDLKSIEDKIQRYITRI